MLRLRIKTYITYRKCPVPLIKKFWIRTGCLYGKTTHFIISSGHTFLLFVKTFDFNLNLKWFCLVWELSLPPCISLMYHKNKEVPDWHLEIYGYTLCMNDKSHKCSLFIYVFFKPVIEPVFMIIFISNTAFVYW